MISSWADSPHHSVPQPAGSVCAEVPLWCFHTRSLDLLGCHQTMPWIL